MVSSHAEERIGIDDCVEIIDLQGRPHMVWIIYMSQFVYQDCELILHRIGMEVKFCRAQPINHGWAIFIRVRKGFQVREIARAKEHILAFTEEVTGQYLLRRSHPQKDHWELRNSDWELSTLVRSRESSHKVHLVHHISPWDPGVVRVYDHCLGI